MNNTDTNRPGTPPDESARHRRSQSTAALTLLALGIVYGDIGTSPLYAVKATFSPEHGMALSHANILGGVSAILWALLIIVTLKYVVLVLRANNRGEGGIMALLALATASARSRRRTGVVMMVAGVVGASLFYGEAVLTPAISVLSAVEGLEVGTQFFKPYILPVSTGILVGLFMIQKWGTGFVGLLFGPVCALWFCALAASGIWNITLNPAILAAINPLHAIRFVTSHGYGSFVVLGSVLLAITGAEALYADMGHFGKRAIRTAWFGLVAPALVLNYFGQGALLMGNPEAITNPFYLAFPQWALYPMVVLATAATVIASQATISGAFSITQQAIKLGYLPRMAVLHTSSHAKGQIYVPTVNWILLAAVLAAMLGFGSSSSLASAYGVAVIGTMLSTTLLTFFVIRRSWGYPMWLSALASGFFGLIELMFLTAALSKVTDGGWFPLLMGAMLFAVMMTWRHGRKTLQASVRQSSVPLAGFLTSLFRSPPQRVSGTAVFLNSAPDSTPHSLLHSLKHYKVLHDRNVFLTVEFEDVPWVPEAESISCENMGNDCWRVMARYGFMNGPDVSEALERCGPYGLEVDPNEVSWFLSREKIVPSARERNAFSRWRFRLFAAMARNAGTVTDFFGIPTNRVVELGTRVAL